MKITYHIYGSILDYYINLVLKSIERSIENDR